MGDTVLDDIDRKLLNGLASEAKTPLRKLASGLGVSFVTVKNRIARLQKSGILREYSARIDFSELGYDIHVLIDVRIAKGKLIELEKRIARSPNIYAVYDTTGEFDATILGRFRSTRTMDRFLKTMQQYDFIERTNTRLILNTIKDSQVRL
jgi:DNA-binding Lrp family transcriptional regulator